MNERGLPTSSLHDQAVDLLEAYTLDALERDETDLVNKHLDGGCDHCEQEVHALQEVAERLPLAAPLVSARAVLKRNILAEVEATLGRSTVIGPAAHTESGGRGRLVALAASWRPEHFSSMAASMVVLVVAGLLSWNIVLQSGVDDLNGENQALLSSMAGVEQMQQDAEFALAEAQVDMVIVENHAEIMEARMTAFLSVVGTPEQERVSLSATDEAPAGAWGNLLVNPRDGTFIVVASGLEPNVDGGYVLWVHDARGATPMVFFVVDALGTGIGHGKIEGGVAEARVTISHEYDADVNRPSPAKLERLNP